MKLSNVVTNSIVVTSIKKEGNQNRIHIQICIEDAYGKAHATHNLTKRDELNSENNENQTVFNNRNIKDGFYYLIRK